LVARGSGEHWSKSAVGTIRDLREGEIGGWGVRFGFVEVRQFGSQGLGGALV